jgi:hypothetical protein
VVLGCSPDEDFGQIKISMVDSPAEYDAVAIFITGIEAHQAGADSNGGWISIGANGMYDLLTLRNGLSAVIADKNLPAGHYTQIRLLLGEGNNVVVDGQQFPLEIPSGMQSGIKLNHQFTIEPNRLYDLMLDFDAERSVIVTGSGGYQLKPVIRLQAVESAGSISGFVLPVESASTVSTIVGLDTVSAFADSASGYFKLMAIPGGSYPVIVTPALSAYRDSTIEAVTVVSGQNTDLGEIVLLEVP